MELPPEPKTGNFFKLSIVETEDKPFQICDEPKQITNNFGKTAWRCTVEYDGQELTAELTTKHLWRIVQALNLPKETADTKHLVGASLFVKRGRLNQRDTRDTYLFSGTVSESV